jgi:hypothetical protein
VSDAAPQEAISRRMNHRGPPEFQDHPHTRGR